MNEPQDRSLGELFAALARDTSNLVRQEVNLAKVEISQKVTKITRDIGMVAVGGAIAYAALLAIMAGIILLLGRVMPLWGAALLVGVVVAIISGVMISKALSALKKENLVPEQTIETLKEDTSWAKNQVT